MKVAIIGTGISGLSCAYFLRGRHDITLFDQNSYVGGHTHTVDVKRSDGGGAPVDTGFMVYNEVTYPHLARLFRELDVETAPTAMSFSVTHEPDGVEFSGSSLNHLFAQRRNLLKPRYWRMLRQLNRFNREASTALRTGKGLDASIGDYVQERGYGEDFLQWYLIPMSSAVWSTAADRIRQFPARTLLRFFYNHGFLGLHTQHPWRTVRGGARSYVQKLLMKASAAVRLDARVLGIQRCGGWVEVTTSLGTETFERVILAGHADETLGILKDATEEEQRLLSTFKYQENVVTLHTDASVMPQTKLCWSSWNHRVDGQGGKWPGATTTYWMNSLQQIPGNENFFITVDSKARIDPAHIRKELRYHHPIFSMESIRAQQNLPSLNHQGRGIYFAGSYFGYGFHEDGLKSGVDVSERILEGSPWR